MIMLVFLPCVLKNDKTPQADYQLVVFGGHYYAGKGQFKYLNDTHVLDMETMTWHPVQCDGDTPPARYGHTAELVGTRMFIFGGKGEDGALMRDTYFLDLPEWCWVGVNATTAGPSARFNHASLLVGRKIVVHGGWDGQNRCMNDLWVFDTDAFTWMRPRTSGPPPSPRYGHSMNLLPDGRIVMFGGVSVSEQAPIPHYHGDLIELDTESMVWSQPHVTGDHPTARYGHTLAHLDAQHAVLFGGWGAGGIQSGGGAIRKRRNHPGNADSLIVIETDVGNMRWQIPFVGGKPPADKFGHTCTQVGNAIFVFGGWNGQQAVNDLDALSLT